jgi:protein-glutamine gamma-glutamyltransferase
MPVRADRVSLLFTYVLAGVGVSAAVLHVSPLLAVLLAVCVCVGLAWDLRDSHPLSTWLLNFLIITGILVTLALPNENGIIGRLLAGSIVLLAGKLLAPKAARDQLQIMLLSFLLLLGAAILSLNLSFAVLFGLYLLLSTLALIWLPFGSALGKGRVDRNLVRRMSLLGVGVVALSIPVVVLFFVALPRAGIPFWRGIAPLSAQSAGFTDQVSLGDVGRIAESNEIAFRAELQGVAQPLPFTPYWRGVVFEETDGITWKKATEPTSNTGAPWAPDRPYPQGPEGPPPRRTAQGIPLEPSGQGSRLTGTQASLTQSIKQTIYLEPQGLATLFGLDRPSEAQTGLMSLAVWDGVIQVSRPVMQRLRYEVVSEPSAWLPQPLDNQARARCLSLPGTLPAVVAQRAREVVGSERDPYRQTQLLLQHFHSGYYTYSLAGPGPGANQLETFLTGSHTGYCEHFAAAMALMLRSLGVPARMVGGYVGGDFNPSGDYYLVQQRSAHVWVEAYIDGLGWLRLDPTPPSDNPAASDAGSTLSGASGFLDSLRLKWYSLVIGYDLSRQFSLFKGLSDGIGRGLSFRPRTAWLATYLPFILAVTAAVAGFLFWRSRRRRDKMSVIYARLARQLRRRGFVRAPEEGYLDFAERAGKKVPEDALPVRAVTDGYLRHRYAGTTPDPDELRHLRHLLRRVKV